MVVVRVVHWTALGWSPAERWMLVVVLMIVVRSWVGWRARAARGMVVMVVVRTSRAGVGPHNMTVAHGVGSVGLRAGMVRMRRVAVVVIVVRGWGMRGVQLRVGVVVGVHTSDRTRGQLAGVDSHTCNNSKQFHNIRLLNNTEISLSTIQN